MPFMVDANAMSLVFVTHNFRKAATLNLIRNIRKNQDFFFFISFVKSHLKVKKEV